LPQANALVPCETIHVTKCVPAVPHLPVESAADARLDPFRNLKGQGARSDRTFVAESELVLERLFHAAVRVRAILITPARAERLGDLLGSYAAQSGVGPLDIFVAPQAVINEVVGYPLHRGVIALAERPQLPSPESVLRPARTVVVLEEVMDPDNVGAVFRHCAGFGVDAILLHGPTADPLYRKTIRTSMGWTIQMPYARMASRESAVDTLRRAGFVTLALTPSRSAEVLSDVLAALDESTPIAFLLGAEGPGLKDSTMESVDHRARIPLSDGVDSLNIATAAAIALYALVNAQPTRLRRTV
jgi:tRNA G18 (ribose-2'-O)-methylase SpoU